MGASKNPAKKTREDDVAVIDQPPVVVPEAESDDEYEQVPSRKAKSTSQKPAVHAPSADVVAAPNDASKTVSDPMDVDQPSVDQAQPNAAVADDDDWLRSRTNRLLDLVNDDEIPAVVAGPSISSNTPVVPVVSSNKEADVHMDTAIEETVEEPVSSDEKTGKLSALDTVHKTSRIFVRNLPYSATEEELHEYFGKFGELEEVSQHFPSLLNTQTMIL